MPPPIVRKGMPPRQLDRDTFERRYRSAFIDPVFEALGSEIEKVTAAAWDAYSDSRKSPHTRKAGIGFADPNYEIAVDWLAARDAVESAQKQHDDPANKPRVLLINGSSRTEHTCPGEMSKSWRLVELVSAALRESAELDVDILDLSRTTSEYGVNIHPCKSCVSTSMALCHWPCSCYPNYSLGQVHDWMSEIYPLWVAAHGIMIVAPVNWYHAPGPLKSMIDRLVCADGGNPDPSSTHGKNAAEAKTLELKGWPYPRHLAGRLFAAVCHGDSAGAESFRRSLVDWASDIRLIPVAHAGELDRYIGYYEPYATSHDTLDADKAVQEEVKNAARALAEAVIAQREGKLTEPGAQLHEPRPK
jgi:multimeric flavodoxin WrbA